MHPLFKYMTFIVQLNDNQRLMLNAARRGSFCEFLSPITPNVGATSWSAWIWALFLFYLMIKTHPLGCDSKIPSPADLSLNKDVRLLHLFIFLTFPFLTRLTLFLFLLWQQIYSTEKDLLSR